MSSPGVVDILLAGLRDTSGQPLAGGKVSCYSAGTSNLKDVFTDAAGTTAATNPVILNSNGQAQVYAYGNYKFIVTDSDDTTLYTWDDLAFASPLALITDWQAFNPTYGGQGTLTYTGVTTHTARYCVVGNAIIFHIRTTAGTVGGAGTGIYIDTPAGLDMRDNGAAMGCLLKENSAFKLGVIGRQAANRLVISQDDGTNFAAVADTYFGAVYVGELT